jgi:capsular polysaccharide transport system permease protein
MTNARRYLKPDSARFQELANRVKSIQAQIDSQKARLTGPDGAMAPVLVEYQKLMLEQQFADQDYNAALTSLESARLDAEKQHLFLVRVVEPNHPEDSTYPKSFLTVVSLLLGLTVAYCIGWLIFTGFREHAS